MGFLSRLRIVRFGLPPIGCSSADLNDRGRPKSIASTGHERAGSIVRAHACRGNHAVTPSFRVPFELRAEAADSLILVILYQLHLYTPLCVVRRDIIRDPVHLPEEFNSCF